MQLPWGDTGFDINALNAVGFTIMRRALDWASSPPFSGSAVLFVVGDPANLTPEQIIKRDLMESWGHKLTYVATGDTQAEFDAAVAAAEVVYVPELGTTPMSELGSKLDDAPKGLITKEARKVFGMASFEFFPRVDTDSIGITDNTHHISQTLPLGPVPLTTSIEAMWKLGGTLAIDLHVLGELTGGVVGLAYLEAGELRNDSSPAPARRVKLPWGFDTFDVNLLTPDALEIMKRAIVWGAGGSGGGGGGGGPSCSAIVADDFESDGYGGSTAGSLPWSGDWAEVNEADGSSSGDEQAMTLDTRALRVRDNDGGGEGVERGAELSGHAIAELTLQYRRDGLDDADDYVVVEVSGDGGSNWAEAVRIKGDGTDASWQLAASNVSAFIGADFRIRIVSSPTMGNVDSVYLDDVEICLN